MAPSKRHPGKNQSPGGFSGGSKHRMCTPVHILSIGGGRLSDETFITCEDLCDNVFILHSKTGRQSLAEAACVSSDIEEEDSERESSQRSEEANQLAVVLWSHT